MKMRSGAASVAELLLVAWLFALIMAGVGRYAASQRQLAMVQQDQLRMEEAVRTISVILGTELRHVSPEDLAAVATDSVRMRAFRGGGPICAATEDRVQIEYRGVRQPDIERDSVILLGPLGATAHGLSSVGGTAACLEGVEARIAAPPPADAGYALFFETGVYSVADGALRYRRGLGGRQPLTEAILRDLVLHPSGQGILLHLAPDTDSLRRLGIDPRRVGLATLNIRWTP
jgi:hypothetical protein